MASLVVLKFDTPSGAEQALAKLGEISKQHLITISDAAIVTWPEDRKKPKTKQAHDLTLSGALSGGFWGMLFGLIFFVPFLGLAVGAAMGAVTGAMSDIGINDDFIEQCQNKITKGTSGLFLLAETSASDRVIDALKPYDPEVISTNLSKEQEDKLKAAFEEE